MSKTILVTGVNGFVGHHLVRELKKGGHAVIGAGYDPAATDENSKMLTRYIQCDLTSKTDVEKHLSFDGIDAVIHLAGLANVGQSFTEPAFFLSANASMAINVLQHAYESKSKTRFVVVSSGAVYESRQPLPITESGTLTHGSPYAVSKLAVEMMSDYYRGRDIDVVTVRPFNHFGPDQGRGFIVPDLYAQLCEFRDNGTPLKVGDLSTARDYTDARDVVRAYVAIATSDRHPAEAVYNVCSGGSRTGTKILAALTHAMKLPAEPVINIDETLIRPNDAKDLYGDNSRLRQEFGWKPEIPFEQTINDITA